MNRQQQSPKNTYLIFQTEADHTYELVITNASGLYRYRFGDVIKVVGFHNTCPVIEFHYRYLRVLTSLYMIEIYK